LFPTDHGAISGLGEVAWQLTLELGKVTGDHSDVETPQDRFLGFVIKEESEGRLDATLRRVRAHRQSFPSLPRHRDVMASLAISRTDDDLEFEGITFAGPIDLDHSLLSPLTVQFGCKRRFFTTSAQDPTSHAAHGLDGSGLGLALRSPFDVGPPNRAAAPCCFHDLKIDIELAREGAHSPAPAVRVGPTRACVLLGS